MHKRIFLTETKSILAQKIAQVIEQNEDLKLVTDPDIPPEATTDLWKSYQQIVATMRELRPDILIILPGHTPYEVENYALGSQLIGSKVIYISSAEVFDGMKSVQEESAGLVNERGEKQVKMRYVPYDEYDFQRPVTPAGLQAIHGEQYIQRYARKYLILRPGYLFDEATMKMVDPKKLLPIGNPLISPTRMDDFATAIGVAIDQGLIGVYHIVNTGKEKTVAELILHYQPFVKINLVQPKETDRYDHNQMLTGHKFTDRTGYELPELIWEEKKLRVVK